MCGRELYGGSGHMARHIKYYWPPIDKKNNVIPRASPLIDIMFVYFVPNKDSCENIYLGPTRMCCFFSMDATGGKDDIFIYM